ncbi:hypothetical protein MATL_G00078120 [Megalops atlanticus]|uniref:C2H2-type domain-containing protein n=1 Tax=Megalops atlanticus TaxID=7932 RepID=A0A9D3QB25_MEGAT|nr:hypothetical protein MATL_G00078120 [Megalops atlanticus]
MPLDIEKLSALGSEGEDEGGLWGMETQDSQDNQDKTSLTPSEGTEPGTPTRCAHPHSLSPEDSWTGGELNAPAAGDRDRDRNREPLMIYGEGEDPRGLEDLAHYDFLMQLRQAADTGGRPDLRQAHNGTAADYRHASIHEEMHSHHWSSGTRGSPEGQEVPPTSPDAMRALLVCPFCQRTYRRDASLREHIKFCHERGGGHLICPLCGYIATHRAQMERHMVAHNQAESKHPMYDHPVENRKFKCLQCGKAFKYKHHLKEHLRIHSGEKPYECSNCKKRFSHSGSYSSHLSSKKCLSGAGGGGVGGGLLNGQAYGSYLNNSSPSSPPATSGRNGGKGPPFPFQDSERQADRVFVESPTAQHPGSPLLQSLELRRLWDPAAELSHRADVFKGTALLPYLHAGGKFEHVLQEMLRRGEYREEGTPAGAEERALRGAGSVGKASTDGYPSREGAGPGGEPPAGGVTCRWCSQLFPSPAVLLQHERYLCKMNREAIEVLEAPRDKDSTPLNFSRPALPAHDAQKAAVVTNGFNEDKSPLRRPAWHPLGAMRSPLPPRSDALASRSHWPTQEAGSPTTPASPAHLEMSSPSFLEKRRVSSSGFNSPLCLDLSINASPPTRPTPPCRTPSSASSQNEPLDLSLPKLRRDPEDDRGCNGRSPTVEKREAENHYRRLTQPPHQRPGTYSGTPLFGGSMYSAFPLFNPILPPGLGGSVHQDGLTALSFNPPAHNAGFLSPMGYMLESDTDSILKRIQGSQALMFQSEAMSRDYLSLMEEGVEGEGGPGRKRLKKTDEGLYACDICDKTFQKSSSLLRHKYEHTGKRPHECKICKKAFKHKHHLIEHSRLHSGEKPYQCDKCGKRFSHSGSYSQHMNHRYAYCSRDQDADGTGEDLGDMSLCPTRSLDLGPLAAGAGLGLEGAPGFFSDSSLDGAPGGPREEDERSRGAPRAKAAGAGGAAPPRPSLTDGSSLTGDGELGSEDGSEGSVRGLESRGEPEANGTDREGEDSCDRDRIRRDAEPSTG